VNGAIQPDGVARPDAPYSPVFASGDLVYTAGQIGADANGTVADGIEAQTRQALENLRLCLEAAGCGLGDVMKVNAYLTDMENFSA
jgi:2-iminobutanoate/2-iminopropanoate deaminase